MKRFEEILEESKQRKFAFLLDGVQANITLLLLEIVLSEDPTRVRGFTGSMKENLKEVKAKILHLIKSERFITLDGLSKFSEQEDTNVKNLVEKIYDDAHKEDGTR